MILNPNKFQVELDKRKNYHSNQITAFNNHVIEVVSSIRLIGIQSGAEAVVQRCSVKKCS